MESRRSALSKRQSRSRDWLDRARLLDIYASHSLIDRRRFADRVLYLPNSTDIAPIISAEGKMSFFAACANTPTFVTTLPSSVE